MYSLIVTTFNRTAFLDRLCRYYMQQSFRRPIIVADASAPEHVQAVQDAVERARAAGLDITYRQFPNHYADIHCLAEVLADLPTPLFAWVADDDFLVPETLERAAAVLNAQPDVAAATGWGMTFSTVDHAACGVVRAVNSYGTPERLEQSARDRVIAHGRSYRPTTFSLRRRDHALAHYRVMGVNDLFNNKTNRYGGFFGEFFDSLGTVARGRSVKVPGLMMVRQAHLAMTSASANAHFDAFHWVSDPRWAGECALTVQTVGQYVAETDGISAAEGQEAVRLAVWAYTANLLTTRQKPRPDPGIVGRVQRAANARIAALRIKTDHNFAMARKVIESVA